MSKHWMTLAMMLALSGVVAVGCDDDDTSDDAGNGGTDSGGGGEDAGPIDAGPPGTPLCGEDDLNDDQQEHYDDIAGPRLDDDLGFDESARLMEAGVSNNFSTNPTISATSATLSDPNYLPGVELAGADTITFNSFVPSDTARFDTSVDFAGAIDMGADDWTEGWTDYPNSDGGADCTPGEDDVITGTIDTDTTLTEDCYYIDGRVFVEDDSTLTIPAGTILLGRDLSGVAGSIIVTRGSQLVAVGASDNPIVFTSANAPNARATGDWAGIALLGAAGTNDGMENDGGFFEDRIEGIEVEDDRGIYGGNDDASSCGELRYVRIEYAGREFSPDNELNGLTLGACGSGTILSYIQVHRGKDDGIEFFGGTASLDHIVISGASDDSLDFDEGWRGNGQFIVIHQFDGIGDRAIEADNLGSDEDAEPRTRPNLWNLTLIGGDDHQVAMFREGMQGILGNLVVVGHGAALDVRASTADPDDSWAPTSGDPTFRIQNSFFSGGSTGDFDAEDLDASGVCNEAADTWTGSPDWPTT